MIRGIMRSAHRVGRRGLCRSVSSLRTGTNERVVRRIESLFLACGRQAYIGEDVSIMEHGLQTARMAEAAGEDIEAQLGALLHDVGHLLLIEANLKMQMEGVS